MRQYAWYSPELDVIVLQTIMENCYMYEVTLRFGTKIEPMDQFLWSPLGEI